MPERDDIRFTMDTGASDEQDRFNALSLAALVGIAENVGSATHARAIFEMTYGQTPPTEAQPRDSLHAQLQRDAEHLRARSAPLDDTLNRRLAELRAQRDALHAEIERRRLLEVEERRAAMERARREINPLYIVDHNFPAVLSSSIGAVHGGGHVDAAPSLTSGGTFTSINTAGAGLTFNSLRDAFERVREEAVPILPVMPPLRTLGQLMQEHVGREYVDVEAFESGDRFVGREAYVCAQCTQRVDEPMATRRLKETLAARLRVNSHLCDACFERVMTAITADVQTGTPRRTPVTDVDPPTGRKIIL